MSAALVSGAATSGIDGISEAALLALLVFLAGSACIVVGLLLAAMPGLARSWAPDRWAWLCRGLLIGGFLLLLASLALSYAVEA